MPTVIDELVVRLGLDSSQFPEGERSLIESLRRMEAAAQRGGRQVTESVGRGTIDFFRAVENPIAALKQQFQSMVLTTGAAVASTRVLGTTGAAALGLYAGAAQHATGQVQNLAAQGQAAGASVGKSMSLATGAVRALGIAGLAAFAVYETLTKTLQAAGGVAGKVLTTGIGAGAAGMDITEFGAVSQALLAGGHVPQAETQGFLAGYESTQLQAATGVPAGVQAQAQLRAKLAQVQALVGDTGIDPARDTPEQMITKLARTLAAAPEAQAQAAGRVLDLSPLMVHGLRAEGERLPADIAFQRSRAPHDRDQAAAQRFLAAQDRLSTAWERLAMDITLRLEPALTAVLGFLDRLISGGLSGILGGAPPKPGEPGYWLDEHHNVAPPYSPGASTGAPGIVAAARAAGASDSAIATMLSAAMVEGGLGADSWKPNAEGSGAVGRWQMLGDELKRYRAEGGTPGDDAAQTRYVLKRLNEIMPGFSTSTDEAAQVAAITKFESSGQGTSYYARGLGAARKLVAGEGTAPTGTAPTGTAPTGAAPTGAVPTVSAAEYDRLPEGAAYRYPGDPPDKVRHKKSGEPPAGGKYSSLDMVRSYQLADASSRVNTTNHHYDYGDNNITVNAPAREGSVIADSISDELSRVQLANRANTGLG